MPINVAIVGSGIFVKDQHLPSVLATPDLVLKAVYSRSLKSAHDVTSALEQKPAFYSDDTEHGYDDLLADEEIQAVIIALPIPIQPTFIKKALQAGKHVLSEKPIAKDAATARGLLEWYDANIDGSGVTWGVAENYRYFKSFVHGAEQVRKLGKVLSFRARMNTLVAGGKYFETPWRKSPEYQGGFLLDGGIHFVAALRLLLGPADLVVRASAFSARLQPHLPPVDTVHAVLKTASGASGTFDVSFGTTDAGSGWVVACERGSVAVDRGVVTVTRTGEGEAVVEEFEDEFGVKAEVRAWAEGLGRGELDARQGAGEALRDLDVLEAMLRSGEGDGVPVDVVRR